MQFHTFRVDGPQGACLGECRLPAARSGLPALAFVPDLCFTRAYGFYGWLADALSSEVYWFAIDAGLPLPRGGDDADLAARARGYTLSRELAGWLAGLRALEERRLPCAGAWNGSDLVLLGHGKGAALALHLDRRLRAGGGIAPRALVLLCPPATLVREAGRGRPAEVSLDDAGTLALGDEFLADARRLAQIAPLDELVAECPAPILVIAAEEDAAFPPAEAERLVAQSLPGRVRLLVLEEVGHFLGCGHPFTRPSPALRQAAEAIRRFLNERLRAPEPGRLEGGAPR